MSPSPTLDGVVRFGAFELDVRAGELRKGRQRLHLQPQPFKVLSVLVSRAAELVTREDLQRQIWDGETFVDFDQGLNVCIRQIRAALGESAAEPRFVETVPRRGYRFVARNITIDAGRPRVREAGRAIGSVAVLPFESSGGADDVEYLCHGIAESLINSLSHVRRLRVVPRGTAFRYKGAVDLAVIRRDLNVGALITGRIVPIDGRINVQVELVDVATDSQMWGGQYTRDLSGIFEMQEEIAREICDNLRLRLRGHEKKQLRKRSTHNPAAYQLYLRGRYCSEKRTDDGLRQAIEYFRQAIAKDRHFALAYAGIADACTLLGSGTYGAWPAAQAMTEAKAMAEKALAIDGTLAEAHTSLAFLRFRFDWAWPDAERSFRRAIGLNPRYARAHHWYALFLAAMDRCDDAVVEINRAVELDPLALTINTAAGRISHFARRFDDAIDRFIRTLDLDPRFVPAHFDLGAAYLQKSMFQEALAEFQTCVALSGGNPLHLAAVAEAHARLGQTPEATAILGRLQNASREQYLSPVDLALVYCALGDRNQAFASLESAYERRDASLVWFKVAPECDPLRGDPRFEDLLRRMNLTAAV